MSCHIGTCRGSFFSGSAHAVGGHHLSITAAHSCAASADLLGATHDKTSASAISVSGDDCYHSSCHLKDSGGRELPRPTRARDRSLCARRSHRCDHAPARTKTVGTRGQAVLCREYGWWRWQCSHGPRGKNGARWLHVAHDQPELRGQSNTIRQGPL